MLAQIFGKVAAPPSPRQLLARAFGRIFDPLFDGFGGMAGSDGARAAGHGR